MASDTSDENKNEPRRGGGPIAFFGEVRAEARKVTWATRQEVTVSTIMVLIMVALAAVFFFAVDSALRLFMRLFLGIE